MDVQPVEILKWIGIVLAAGFVGYFGRYLAMLILDRFHKGKARVTAEEPTRVPNKSRSASCQIMPSICVAAAKMP